MFRTSHAIFVATFASALAAQACTNGDPASNDDRTDSSLAAEQPEPQEPQEKTQTTCSGGTPMCAAGTKLVDSDGDGCEDTCEPIACPPFVPTCQPGEKIADVDGDGCALECAPCPAILCQAGTKQVDSNGDGCFDACK